MSDLSYICKSCGAALKVRYNTSLIHCGYCGVTQQFWEGAEPPVDVVAEAERLKRLDETYAQITRLVDKVREEENQGLCLGDIVVGALVAVSYGAIYGVPLYVIYKFLNGSLY